jgi:hypothetical protein
VRCLRRLWSRQLFFYRFEELQKLSDRTWSILDTGIGRELDQFLDGVGDTVQDIGNAQTTPRSELLMKLFEAARGGLAGKDVKGNRPEREDVYLGPIERAGGRKLRRQVNDALFIPRQAQLNRILNRQSRARLRCLISPGRLPVEHLEMHARLVAKEVARSAP